MQVMKFQEVDFLLKSVEEKIAQLKEAEIKTQLLPHQQRVVDKIQNQRGLVVAHGVGSGKTLSAIAAQDALQAPATVVTPAALKANYLNEVKKHSDGAPPIHQESIENIARKGTLKENPLTIVDESHRLRNPQSESTKALKRSTLNKILLLTGTPMYNSASDISPLVNLAAGENLLPENKSEFEDKYFYEKQIKPGLIDRLRGVKPGTEMVLNRKTTPELQNILNKWVDYHPSSKEGFPEVEEEEIKVPMTEHQTAIYDTIMDQAPAWVAQKVRAGLPPSKAEARQLNAYLQSARISANTTAPFITKGDPEAPKIQKAFENLKAILDKDPQNKGIVFSNYLDGGLNPYSKLLEEAKIPYGSFTGSLKPSEREEMVNKYNAGKLRALLLSPAGGEGLNLKGSTVAQLLDPGWNISRGEQAQARAIRYGSHSHLPPEKQKVLVQKYLATRPRRGILESLKLKDPGGAVDEYLTQLGAKKDALNQQIIKLMEQPQPEIQQKIASAKTQADKFFNTKNYQLVINNINSKKFVEEVLSRTKDLEFKSFLVNNHKHKKKAPTQLICSSNSDKKYEVKKHKDGSYTCGCANFMYKQAPINGECKHIVEAKKNFSKTAKDNTSDTFEVLQRKKGWKGKILEAVKKIPYSQSRIRFNSHFKLRNILKQPNMKLAAKGFEEKSKSFGSTLGSLIGGSILLHKGINFSEKAEENRLRVKHEDYSYKNPNVKSEDYFRKRVDVLAKRMGVPSPDKIETGSPSYMPSLDFSSDPELRKNTISGKVTDTEGTILHELGHHKNWYKRTDKTKVPYALLRAAVTHPVSVLGASLYTSTKEDPESNVGAGFAAASVPHLLDEGIASGRAFNTLRKMYGLKKGLRKSVSLIPSFGSYALAAALPQIGTQFNKYFSNQKTQ
jgi:superfamily II DNA/RNA helicase